MINVDLQKHFSTTTNWIHDLQDCIQRPSSLLKHHVIDLL